MGPWQTNKNLKLPVKKEILPENSEIFVARVPYLHTYITLRRYQKQVLPLQRYTALPLVYTLQHFGVKFILKKLLQLYIINAKKASMYIGRYCMPNQSLKTLKSKLPRKCFSLFYDILISSLSGPMMRAKHAPIEV